MKPYLIALAVGLLVGVIYGLLNVRSPAPPVVALVGLLGILLGEQMVPLAKRMIARPAVADAVEPAPDATPEPVAARRAAADRSESRPADPGDRA